MTGRQRQWLVEEMKKKRNRRRGGGVEFLFFGENTREFSNFISFFVNVGKNNPQPPHHHHFVSLCVCLFRALSSYNEMRRYNRIHSFLVFHILKINYT